MRILVTGGTGFVGKHLVRHVRALADFVNDPLEHEVKTVSRRRSDTIVSETDKTDFFFYTPTGSDDMGFYQADSQHYSGDLTNPDLVKRLFSYYKPDVISHLAGNPLVKNPEGIFRDNVEVTQNLLTYCPKGCRFVFASSIVVYGDGSQHPKCTEYFLPNPTSEYGITKLASEHLVNMFTKRGRVRGVNLRLCATVGSGLTHGVIHDFIKKLQSDSDTLEVLGAKPGSTKPYLHVDDAVRAFMLMVGSGKSNLKGSWNVVPDNEVNIEQLANAVMVGVDIKKDIVWLGEGANWAGDNRYLCASNANIKSVGWKPTYNSSFGAIAQAVREIG